MKVFAIALASLAFAAASPAAEKPHLLDKANVLPLAIDDAFEFRKTKLFLNEPNNFRTTVNQMINFERARAAFGAVSAVERQQRYGHYFTFFWRAERKADITVRLEYRQENLGSYVQARELKYAGAKGSMKSQFEVIGDDYNEDGKITAWRAVLIENGRIVALNQSFLWN